MTNNNADDNARKYFILQTFHPNISVHPYPLGSFIGLLTTVKNNS